MRGMRDTAIFLVRSYVHVDIPSDGFLALDHGTCREYITRVSSVLEPRMRPTTRESSSDSKPLPAPVKAKTQYRRLKCLEIRTNSVLEAIVNQPCSKLQTRAHKLTPTSSCLNFGRVF